MRALEELIDREDTGILLIAEMRARPDANESTLLAPDTASRGSVLESLQVTTRSSLGAIAYETGGLVVGHGLLRILGSGVDRSLLTVNDLIGRDKEALSEKEVLFIADDVLGGLFALNGGRFGQDALGEIFHLPADDTIWTSLDVGYTEFISGCLTGDLSLIYPDLQKAPWSGAAAGIGFDKVRSYYPFLWTREGRGGVGDARLVAANENLRLRVEMLGYSTG